MKKALEARVKGTKECAILDDYVGMWDYYSGL